MSATFDDQARIPPRFAADIITRFTRPGDTILDPDCGAGTVLVEAMRAGRHAVGSTRSSRCWTTARANVRAAKDLGARVEGMVLDAEIGATASTELDSLSGQVRLLLTTVRIKHPPRGRTSRGVKRPSIPEVEHTAVSDLGGLLTRARTLLQPGAAVVVTVPPRRFRRELLDLPRCVVVAGQTAGLRWAGRAITLTAERVNDLFPSDLQRMRQRRSARPQDSADRPVSETAHWDNLIFRTPDHSLIAQLASPPRCSAELALEQDWFAVEDRALVAA